MTSLSHLSFEDQMATLVALVKNLKPVQLIPKALEEILNHARGVPPQFIPTEFASFLSTKFQVDVASISSILNSNAHIPLDDFDALVPSSGWLCDYVEYTRQTEPPTVFHFFSGLTILGATLARRIYFPRGSGDIFPNICCVLVAPPGRCKKTTACNLAVNLFRRIGGNVLADKITPEAIVDSFQQQATATGLIYAPEWSVFLGKQQYLEGLVPMLTALFDCPSVWSSTTVMRGTSQLHNVALSHLAATTIDWLQTSTTKDAFSGGFMSRLLFIVQHTTRRSFPLPPPLSASLGKKLVDGLLALQHIVGEMTLASDAERWYVQWYTKRSSSLTEKHFVGYFERKPDRLLQLAMIMNAAEDSKNFTLSLRTLQTAERILLWIEHFLPSAFEELSASVVGDDQLRLLKQLRKRGDLGHSEWLRLNTSKMGSEMFRKYLETLKQAGFVAYDHTRHRYFILPAGKAVE